MLVLFGFVKKLRSCEDIFWIFFVKNTLPLLTSFPEIFLRGVFSRKIQLGNELVFMIEVEGALDVLLKFF